MSRTKKAKHKMKLPELIGYNVLFAIMIGFMCMLGNMVKSVDDIQKNAVAVNVTSIDDVSTEYVGFTKEQVGGKSRSRYIYRVNRIIHYTYDGKDYDKEDSVTYKRDREEFNYKLKTNYVDDYTYYIDPDDSGYFAQVHNSVESTSVRSKIKTGTTASIIIIVGIAVLMDIVYVLKHRKKEEE